MKRNKIRNWKMVETMIDENTIDILKAIQFFCKDKDDFKIIEADEILAKLPQEINFDKGRLKEVINNLKERGYINVKFATLDEYCIASTKNAEIVNETIEEKSLIKTIATGELAIDSKKVKRKLSKAFWSAFSGAFLGSGIIMTIFCVIQSLI